MSERTYRLLIYSIIATASFIFGVSAGNYATRRILQEARPRSVLNQRFCTIDGKVWWPSREDRCYAEDEPRTP